MATYIPGSKSYMPEFKPFTPDYKFLSAVLDTKTNRYNTNYKQLNDLYSKIVYAPLSRNDTQYMRDQYTKGLSDRLEKISGMDLSLIQNVDAAKGVFKPFFETDIIVKDMVMTKTYQNEVAHANRLMSDTNEERNKLYWNTGVKAMEYKMKDFVDADEKTALSMGLPRYVPNVNLYDLSLEILKESGLSVKQDIVTEDGQWIITQENGNLVTKPALQMLQRKLINDPRVIQAYYTKSYVEGRDFAQKGIDEGRFNSVDQGQRQWALSKISELQKQAVKRADKEQKELEETKATITSWELFLDKYGIVPGSEMEKEMKEKYADYLGMQESVESTNNIVKKASNISNEQSTVELLNRAYNLSMEFNMQNEMIAAAKTYGKINASTTIKMENPEFTRQRQFQIDKAMEAIRQANRMQLAKFEQDLENEAKRKEMASGLLYNMGDVISYGEQGTTSVLQTEDGSGEAVKDIIAYDNEFIEKQANGIDASKVLQILKALPSFQPDKDGNNLYKLNIGGKDIVAPIGDPSSTGGNTLYEILMQEVYDENGNPTGRLKYQDDINKLYNWFNSYLNPPINDKGVKKTEKEIVTNLRKNFPDLVFDIDRYRDLKAGFIGVNQNQNRLTTIVKNRNDHLRKQYELAVHSGLYDKYKEIQGFIDQGLDIDIFKKNGNGWDLKTKEEFINEYVAGAKAGKYKDDLSWMSRNTPFGQDSGHDANYMGKTYTTEIDPYQGTRRVSSNKKVFLEEEARKDAAMLYDHMYTILNNTQNGTYTGEAEQIRNLEEDGQSISGVSPTKNQNSFSTYNVRNAFKGKKPIGTVGDLISSPTYTRDINPFIINQDVQSADLLLTIAEQFNTTSQQAKFVIPGDLATIESSDLSGTSDKIALELLNTYLREMKGWSTSPDKMSKSNPPLATIKYNPQYNAADDISGKYGAYVFKFDGEWLKNTLSFLTAGSEDSRAIDQKVAAEYQTITFAFENDFDINAKNKDAFNFSNVMSEINSSSNGQYYYSVPNGGSIRVNKDVNGDYIGYVRFEQFDSSIGGFKLLPEQKINLTNYIQQQTNTTDYYSYLDSAVKRMEVLLENKMASNKELLEQTNAANNAKK